MYDIIVIGAGVTGTCTARELSKYQVNMCVIDKGDDVASGTSKANSGIVHGGYDCKPGTLMAEMNVRGNELLYELAEDLDYPIKKNGSLIVCTVPGERGKLDVLLEQAKENGVPIRVGVNSGSLEKHLNYLQDRAAGRLQIGQLDLLLPIQKRRESQ